MLSSNQGRAHVSPHHHTHLEGPMAGGPPKAVWRHKLFNQQHLPLCGHTGASQDPLRLLAMKLLPCQPLQPSYQKKLLAKGRGDLSQPPGSEELCHEPRLAEDISVQPSPVLFYVETFPSQPGMYGGFRRGHAVLPRERYCILQGKNNGSDNH
jgi:hypothetical protein